MKVPRRPASGPARRVGHPGVRRRNIVFDDQRPAWDSSTSDLAQFKLDKEELEVRAAFGLGEGGEGGEGWAALQNIGNSILYFKSRHTQLALKRRSSSSLLLFVVITVVPVCVKFICFDRRAPRL